VVNVKTLKFMVKSYCMSLQLIPTTLHTILQLSNLIFRFLFTYVPMSDGARIDVTVSELYDSTYVGNPHDLVKKYSFFLN
jgi:hypothetical protein